jgi:hypothetical protein
MTLTQKNDRRAFFEKRFDQIKNQLMIVYVRDSHDSSTVIFEPCKKHGRRFACRDGPVHGATSVERRVIKRLIKERFPELTYHSIVISVCGHGVYASFDVTINIVAPVKHLHITRQTGIHTVCTLCQQQWMDSAEYAEHLLALARADAVLKSIGM